MVSQTDIVPQMVDAVRNLPFVGPDRMAALEDAYYNAQDGWNQFIYDRTHAPVVTANVAGDNLDQPAAPTLAPTNVPPTATPEPQSQVAAPKFTTPQPVGTPAPAAPALPRPIPPLILSDSQPGEGIWSPVGLPLAQRSRPPIIRTFYRPDPERPYARVDLAWIDLSQTQLTLVPGTSEPRSAPGVPRGEAQIPATVQNSGNLLASWNGGFLTLHGGYGMMVNRVIIAPPKDGFAVLAQYSDGSMHIGIWGRDIKMTSDLVSFRQNGPILIDQGVLNESEMLAWGKSVSGETRIWRSGIGITRDGALIYAAGSSLSAQTLGIALQRAGAVEAMQLDVNAWHVSFFTYELTANGLVPSKLSPAIAGNARMYLTPYDRDFMYLTLKAGSPGLPPRQMTPLPTFMPTSPLLPALIQDAETPTPWQPVKTATPALMFTP
ncbi:MAG: phosphodiester glycosidase family protein [Anaerolineae bacterium]